MTEQEKMQERIIAYRRKMLSTGENRPSKASEHTKKCVQVAIKQTLGK
jgi:hypothetical protein